MKITIKHILYISIALNIGASIWLYQIMHPSTDPLEELYKSQGRVEVLERELEEETIKGDSITVLRDSINILRMAEPKERIIIITKHDKKLEDIDNQSVDSTLQSITDRLNKNRD